MTMIDGEARVARHAATGLLYRPSTMDDAAIREVHKYTCLTPRQDDVLLDVGAHIGAASALFLPHVRYVVAVEPNPENAELLRRNLEPFGARAVVLEAAVRERVDEPTYLYLNNGKDLSSHRVVETRGRRRIPVASYALDALLAHYQPTLLKVDVEGAEYELKPTLSRLPPCVRGLLLELHMQMKDWRDHAQALIDAVAAQGFTPLREPEVRKGNWDTVGVWLRA